jgi:hypothetical protein
MADRGCWRRTLGFRPQSGWEESLRGDEAKERSGFVHTNAAAQDLSTSWPRRFRRASTSPTSVLRGEGPECRRRFGFVAFVEETTKLIRRKTTPLMNFLRQHYLDPCTQHLPFVSSAEGRPFPSVPPFAKPSMEPPSSGRRRSRFFFKRAIMRMCNLYAGALSWLALGSPEWASSGVSAELHCPPPAVERDWDAKGCPLSVLPWDPRTGPATREAIRTYGREIGRLARDTGVFTGLSGGRGRIAEMLLEPTGSGKDQVRSETLRAVMGADVTESAERPGPGIMPFRCKRLAVPERGADVPLLAWTPAAWQEALREPDKWLPDNAPLDKYPRMYLRAPPAEWEAYLRRLGSATMLVGFHQSEVPRGPGGEDLSSGAFAVPKDKNSDRTIIDRRRKNWAEKKCWICQTSITIWTRDWNTPGTPLSAPCSQRTSSWH